MNEPTEDILVRVYTDLNSYLFNLETENKKLQKMIDKNRKIISKTDDLLEIIYEEVKKIYKEKGMEMVIPLPRNKLKCSKFYNVG